MSDAPPRTAARLPARAARRIRRVLAFLHAYAHLLAVSNARVAARILSPRARTGAVLVEVRLESRTAAELAVFATLVSLPPGTVVLEVARHPDRVWVHGMQDEEPDRLRDELRRLEQRFLAAWRATARSGAAPAEPAPEEGPR